MRTEINEIENRKKNLLKPKFGSTKRYKIDKPLAKWTKKKNMLKGKWEYYHCFYSNKTDYIKSAL